MITDPKEQAIYQKAYDKAHKKTYHAEYNRLVAGGEDVKEARTIARDNAHYAARDAAEAEVSEARANRRGK